MEEEKMKIKLAINGFGRIGRLVFRSAFGRKNVEIVGINDLMPVESLAHLLKYDSVYGKLPCDVRAEGSSLYVDDQEIPIFNSRNPEDLPWGDIGVDYVVESTGIFRTKELALSHIRAGARRVIISAPGKGDIDGTFVMGVNHKDFNASKDVIVSNASCTTNCLAPIAKVLNDNYGIDEGLMTTIHAYTAGQNLIDGPNKDLRRARSAALNTVPTSTGAAKAIGVVLPEIKGKLNGMAIRVPTPTVSLVDLTVKVKKPADNVESVNEKFKKASKGELNGILGYEDIPLVSKDFEGDKRSSILDAASTYVMGSLIKVLSWYDNETGYATRVVDLAEYMAANE
tara:strand:- start:1711 stop:2733 length:1023 start_codon:yes stop_codon:yes gene_type:complete